VWESIFAKLVDHMMVDHMMLKLVIPWSDTGSLLLEQPKLAKVAKIGESSQTGVGMNKHRPFFCSKNP
jgi:hypothetical protein